MNTKAFLKMARFVAALLFPILLMDCGGGGGGGSSTDTTPASYPLFREETFVEGHQGSESLTGTDTLGYSYILSIATKTGSITTFNGEQAIPILQIMTLTETTTKQSRTSLSTNFYSVSSSSLRMLGYVDETETGPVTYLPLTEPEILPLSVNIGDQGTGGMFVADNGRSVYRTWQMTDAGNGRANRLTSSTSMDNNGNITGTSNLTYVIDENGNIYSVSYRMYIVSTDDTITFSRD